MSAAIERPKTYEEGLRDGFIEGQGKANKVMEQMLYTTCNPVVCDLPETEVVKLLQKENTELKEELKKWKDEWQEQVQKAIDEGYARTLQTIQLTKATALLKRFIEISNPIYFDEDRQKVKVEAEQFLREIDIGNAIQKANEGLNLDKIAEEVEDDLREGCPDVLCEECTKEDCTVRKLGLVPTKEIEK